MMGPRILPSIAAAYLTGIITILTVFSQTNSIKELDPLTSMEETDELDYFLEETIIKASKIDENITEISSSIGRLDSDQIEKLQLRDINDAFQILGNVRPPQFVDGGFVIRGINSESPDAENISGYQTPLSVIFIDGVALTQQGARRGPSGLWDVENIEIFRGPQSTLQGKNTLAGSVHINTKDPIFDWEGSSRITIGNFNLREYAEMINIPLNDSIAFRFTAEHSEQESFVSYPNLKEFRRFEDFRTTDSLQLRSKILISPVDSPFSMKFTHIYSERSPALSDVFGPNANAKVDSFEDRLWLSSSPNQQIRTLESHCAAWESLYKINNILKLTTHSTYTRADLAVDKIDGNNVRNDLEEDLGQEIRLNWDSNWGRAVAGIFGSHETAGSTLANIDRQRNNLALFGEADFLIDNHWHLIGGGRISYTDNQFSTLINKNNSSETVFLPKAGIRYEFNPEHTLGLTLGRGYQNGGSGIDLDNIPFEFDPSFTFHNELFYRNTFLDGQITLAANAFFSNWQAQQVVLRTIDSMSFNISERVINASKSSLYGGELELSYTPVHTLTMFGSIGLLSTQYDEFAFQIDSNFAADIGIEPKAEFEGYEFPESPELNLNIGFDWNHESGVFLNANATYTSSYFSPVLFAPASSGIGGVSVQVPQNNAVEIDSFVTFNIAAGFEHKDWKFTFFINNIFNEQHVIGKSPGVKPSANGPVFTDNFLATAGAPRTYGASVNLNF